jgi:ankyrin repeat protein
MHSFKTYFGRADRVFAAPVVAALLALSGASTTGFAAGSPVADAAKKGDVSAVAELIRTGQDVNDPTSDGATALLWAAYYSNLELAQALIDAGANVDAANNYGVTPLLQASRVGDTLFIALLLDAGANVELAHPDGATPLMSAALAGSAESVRLLLENGADSNAVDSFQHQSALMWAAAEGHGGVVDVLLAAGADPNLQAKISELTKRKNADFPSGGFTAAMWAVRNGHTNLVEILVAAGADLNVTNGDGATAMMIAIVNDRYDLAARLAELGADVNDGSLYRAVEMRDATTDWYARDGSRLRADHPNQLTALELISVLLDAGADPNKAFAGQMHSATMCCDPYANGTPFYRAAVAADVEALKLLVAHGADLEWTPTAIEGGGSGANGNVGKPALIMAMNGGKGVPLSAGPGYGREGPPPFRELSNREPPAAVAVLLAAGANPNVALPGGASALHQAVNSRYIESIRAVIASGAVLDAKDKAGKTPLQIALALPKEDPANPFGPKARHGGASPDEIGSLLREAMEAAGITIELPIVEAEGDA